jgi:hypothetical protein
MLADSLELRQETLELLAAIQLCIPIRNLPLACLESNRAIVCIEPVSLKDINC